MSIVFSAKMKKVPTDRGQVRIFSAHIFNGKRQQLPPPSQFLRVAQPAMGIIDPQITSTAVGLVRIIITSGVLGNSTHIQDNRRR